MRSIPKFGNRSAGVARIAAVVGVTMLLGGPAIAAPTQLNASDAAANDWFGVTLDASGGLLVVGSSKDDDVQSGSGSVIVFRDSGGGNWSQTQKLTASDPATNQNFGFNIKLDGTRLLVGAPAADSAGSRTGSAYFFEDQGVPGFAETQRVVGSQSQFGDEFGISNGLIGDTALIGGQLTDLSGSLTDAGIAYVFERGIGGSWVETAVLTADVPQAGARFGSRLAFDGTTAAIGAAFEDTIAGIDGGAVYIFKKNLSANWVQTQRIVPTGGLADEWFGTAIAVQGKNMLLGGSRRASNSGGVYYFKDDGTGQFVQQQFITPSDLVVGDGFGDQAWLNGNSLLIGSRTADISPFADAGAVYLFNLNTGGNWQQAAKISNPEPFTNDQFGRYAVLDGSTAFIGTFLDDEPAAGAGSVYVYTDLPVGQEAALAVTSVVQNEAGVVQINFNLTPHDPPPANGYAIRVLAYPTSQDCETTSGIPDLDFDDISTIVSGDTIMSSTGGQGTILWDIRAMDNGPIRQKYYVANGSALFRVFADPVN